MSASPDEWGKLGCEFSADCPKGPDYECLGCGLEVCTEHANQHDCTDDPLDFDVEVSK